MNRLLSSVPLALALAMAALPAHAIDDDTRFVLRAGALNGGGSIEVGGRTTYQGLPASYSEHFDTGRSTVPVVGAQWRIGDRHRLVLDYMKFDGDRDATLRDTISFDDVVIPAGSRARGEAELRLASLAYDFALVESPTVSLGLQLGVQEARVSGRLRAESGTDVYDESDSESAPLPLVGARLTFAPSPAWRVEARAQHVDADWFGGNDYDGTLTMAQALAEYRFGGRFGVHAGYRWMRLDLHDRDVDNGIDAFEQRFHGPVAGLTIAF